jgi:hypothetical protein
MSDGAGFTDDDTLSLDEIIEHIITIHKDLYADWGNGGCAPSDAANLLERSRLDWLVSLAHTLKLWQGPLLNNDNHDAMLILAWANLGSLVEGAMKLFLSVYLHDYEKSVRRNSAASVFKRLWKEQEQKVQDVDVLMFDVLRQFFELEVWQHLDRKEWSHWLKHIQERRNTIHAYKSRELGTFEEFYGDLRLYRKFLLDEITCLPEQPDMSGY